VTDYEPLDLTGLHNADAGVVAGPAPPLGRQTLRGLPFQIGPPGGGPDRPCLIAFGRGWRQEPLRIPVGRPARSLVFAHRQLDSDLVRNGPVGEVVAEYGFRYADGERVVVPIRERFEIAVLPRPDLGPPDGMTWAMASFAFVAVSDQNDYLHPRHEGPWSLAARRQMEVLRGLPVGFQLWAWAGPRPEVTIEAIEIVPCGRPFLLGGVTLGHADEHPFVRTGLETLKVELLAAEDAARPFDLSVAIDRGVATYPQPLPSTTPEQFLGEPAAGWGETLPATNAPSYVQVAATPSASLTLKSGDEAVATARVGELLRRGVVETPRARITRIEGEKNWVHTTVVDDETGRPIPCRIAFRSPAGVPYQPHGHHNHVNSNHPSWHMDVGGDVRLGITSYAYVDGACQGWLPRGEVLVEAVRGFEYEPLRARVRIEPGQQRLELRLKRWANMNGRRWFSGDTHVHFLSTQGSHLEARAEDLNVVNLLLSQWGHLFTNTEEWTGRPSVSADGKTIVYATQENRQHFLGHITLLGLTDPVMPWCSDGPTEAELGGTLEVALAHWADACRAQGGTVVLPHLAYPNGETPALIATGRYDAVEILWLNEFVMNEYYRYLNAGYRVPIVGGTDKMSSETPVGIYRTYVHVPPDEEFGYDAWCRNLRLGRTFHSAGPLLEFSVDGHEVGDTLRLPGNGGTVEVTARATSAAPMHSLQVVKAGRIVAQTVEAGGARELRLRARVKVEGNCWLAARVGGPGFYDGRRTLCSFSRNVFAHTSPVYVACGGGDWWMHDDATVQYMLTMVDGCLRYIRESAWHDRPGAVTHHHGEADHRAYLERPFIEAQAALHRRLHERGIAH
jgi:hypothetical protein